MYREYANEADDGLSKETWRFCVMLTDRVKIELDGWRLETRPSKRHKYRIDKWWGRLSHVSRYHNVEKPEVPEDVQAEILMEVMDGITIE